jgi:uncharacterized LabA/DUF88 family protein
MVLASRNGGFDLLVNQLRVDKGNTAKVYGVATLTAASLMNAASEFLQRFCPLFRRASTARALMAENLCA